MDEIVTDVTLVEVYSEPKISYWNQVSEQKTSKNPFCKTFPLILNRITYTPAPISGSEEGSLMVINCVHTVNK